jgi:hypothetical protein
MIAVRNLPQCRVHALLRYVIPRHCGGGIGINW